MNADLKRIVVIAGGLMGVTAIAGFLYTGARQAEEAATASAAAAKEPSIFERPHSPTFGPATAPVTVVEFFDPECEACRAVYPMVKTVLAEHGDRVRLVLRYMPLHGNAVYAASVLEAAGEQGRYWEMLETLLRYQPEWGSHHQPRPDLIPGYARELGLDMQAVTAAVDSGRFRERIDIDHRDGVALGVRRTPAFFVNGRPLVDLGIEPLRALIADELQRAGAR